MGSGGGPIREDCFDHPLNVRLSAQSQTFSHPHRLTVFPPFPSGSGASPSSSSSVNVSPARTNKSSAFTTSASPSNPTGGVGSSSKSSGGSHPFSFVRGLRKRRAGRDGSESTSHQQHRNLSDLCSDRIRSRTAGDSGWPNCSSRLGGGQDHFGSFGPLTSKSRSDHSLHRILKEDNTWTVFATLRPPSGSSHPTTIFICVVNGIFPFYFHFYFYLMLSIQQIKEVRYPKVRRPGRLDFLATLRLIRRRRRTSSDARRRRRLRSPNPARAKRLPLLRRRNCSTVPSPLPASLPAIRSAFTFRLLPVADFSAATRGGPGRSSGARSSALGAQALLDFRLIQVVLEAAATVRRLLRPNPRHPSRLGSAHVHSRRTTKSRRPRPTSRGRAQQQPPAQQQQQQL